MNGGRRRDVVDPSQVGWRKSSRSSVNANCVEVNADHPDLVHVRDSKNHGTGPTITATRGQWTLLLGDIAQLWLSRPTTSH